MNVEEVKTENTDLAVTTEMLKRSRALLQVLQ